MKKLTKEFLGKRLKRLREKVHMEQDIVARVLQIPRTAVVGIEQGKRDLTAMELCELCKVYRISPNDLLGWNKPFEDWEVDEVKLGDRLRNGKKNAKIYEDLKKETP